MILRDKVETIILDVDGTLSEDISWLKLTEGLGAPSKEHTEIFEAFKHGTLTYSQAKSQLLSLWRETGKANKRFIEDMFASWKLKKDAFEVVNYLRSNYRLCLISGSVDLYIRVIADKLKIKDWYANTKLIWDEKDNLVDFDYYKDQAQKSLSIFKNLSQVII